MPPTRRSFVTNSGWALTASSLFSNLMAQQGGGRAAGTPPSKPYGSGHFGEWIEDEFGLPAFRYTCDQTKDPKAVTPVTPGILSATDHIHQVGNDRIIAIVSNYGHVRVRQDEGAPKFLNDYLPESAQYSGGIGYLTGGGETLSTFYPGNAATFDRTFGIGYFRKTVAGKTCRVDQVISAPFGDDPVLISQVTITNHGDSPADLRWVEYWGCQLYQFSFRSFMEAFMGPAKQRRALGERFTHGFRQLEGNIGIVEDKEFLGYPPEEAVAWQKLKAALAAHPTAFIGPVQETVPKASFDDLHPPSTFLVSLDAPADALSTNAKAFFGSGGAANPTGLAHKLDGKLDPGGSDRGLLLERAFHLNPGESKTLYFLYGYLPIGFNVNSFVTRYRPQATTVWKNSSLEWKKRGLQFSVLSEPWVKRETTWNHYCLRSSLTYDDYFHEHILSQGGIYQYAMGFQGAARDPLQHALPFLFSDPDIVKTVLRYTLKEVRPDGSIPYGIVGHGAVAPMVTDNSSDMPLWLLWAASEYVLATRDRNFLNEDVPTWPLYGPTAGKERVSNLLARCYRHLIDHVGTGEHGVMRMLNDDWNDGLLSVWAQKAFRECVEKGESVLNSAMAAWVFDIYARLLKFTGTDSALLAQVEKSASTHRDAARRQWTGKWLRRAWLGQTLGWMGEETLWLEPQPWAIIGGVTTPEQSRELVQTLNEMLRRASPIGAMQMAQGPDMLKGGMFEGGTSVNGGIWPSLNQTLIWALALVDPSAAWDEWKKNSFARHAEIYPDIWYATWSGSDTYNSVLSKRPGETVSNLYLHYTDFPVLNLHSHACPLYSAAKLIGLEFTPEGLTLRPDLPVESYRFESPLVGVVKSPRGYDGWYAPATPGEWTIAITLPTRQVHLKGKSEPGKPFRWSLRS